MATTTSRASQLETDEAYEAWKARRSAPRGADSTWNTHGTIAKESIVRRTTVRDRAVDAIGCAVARVKEGYSLPYTKAYSADEPYCIIRVLRFTQNDETGLAYVYYQVDGGKVQKMEREKWSDLHYFLKTGEYRTDLYKEDAVEEESYERDF